jgi:hypothetical protein
VERVGARDCLRRAGGGRPGDPVRAVGGQGQQPGPFFAELIKKACTVFASRPGAAQISSPLS